LDKTVKIWNIAEKKLEVN
jgi:WD40 repeat protein